MGSPENERPSPKEKGPPNAHVLFADIVGYSLLTAEDERAAIRQLQFAIWDLPGFQYLLDKDELIYLSTGDGAAIVYFGGPTVPAQFARDLTIKLREDKAEFGLRMGLYCGVVYCEPAPNHPGKVHINVTGIGINMAQRVMDRGDAGHVLLSDAVAQNLKTVNGWKNATVVDLGECEVKHGVKVRIFNLSTPEFGNSSLPNSIRKEREDKAKLNFAGRWKYLSPRVRNAVAIGALIGLLLILDFLVNGSVGPTYIRGQIFVKDSGVLSHAKGWTVKHGEDKAVSNDDGWWTLPLSDISDNGFPRWIRLEVSRPADKESPDHAAQPESYVGVKYVLGPLPFWNAFFPMDDIYYFFDPVKGELSPRAQLLPFFGGIKSVYAQSKQPSPSAALQAADQGLRAAQASCALSLNEVRVGEFPGFFRSSGRAYFQMYLDGKPIDAKAILYGPGIGPKAGQFPLKSDKDLWLPVRTGSDDRYTGLLANLTQVATCSPE
jgi:class 3 adenylate cyclase